MYKNLFNKIIKEDIDSPLTTELTPEDDRNAYESSFENKADAKHFDVEGVPPEQIAQYVDTINSWKSDIGDINGKLENMYKYASTYADKNGADEMFNTISKSVQKILADVGGLEGQLRTLGSRITVNIKRNKINGKK